MPWYRPIRENDDVIDVLCCVILKYNTVREMMKILKQPQSSISEKLRFLIKNKLVKKNKWTFEVNWNGLTKLLKEIAEGRLEVAIGKDYRKYLGLFDNERLEKIMRAYASGIVVLMKPKKEPTQVRKPENLERIFWMYILGLLQTNNEELKDLKDYDKGFIELKKAFEGISEEKILFIDSED